ncbi:MAG: tRNA lysidine(34) synthetase TilS [Parabacteroides distasonis]|nr:tRNA lysidine(34) synthetase TilS [Parabacteroides distasonis]
MRDIVRAYIEKYQLLTEKRPVLVGVSGGADSIALLTLLVELGYSCIAAHCNFHLRGEESERDERFTHNYVEKLHVPFLKVDFDTQVYAQENNLSIEMAARELRYRWFEEQRVNMQAQAIAVAHHQDDQVETLLMNLVRGSSIRGMRGIRPKNGFIIRPLLSVSRDEIQVWLEKRQIAYVTDSTNLSDLYTRNFFRLRVLPLLQEINPSVKKAIVHTANHMSDVEAIYMHAVEEAKRRVIKEDHSLSIVELMRTPSPQTILYEILKDYNFSPSVVDAIYLSFNKESGRIFYSPTHRLIKDRDVLLLTPLTEKKERIYHLDLHNTNRQLPIELSFEEIVITEDFHLQKDSNIAYFDFDKLEQPLLLRTWQKGDWFIPFGMKGRKKLSDYFSDHKFSRLDKERAWLLCSGDAIIWIVGERSDNRYRVDKTTKRVLVVKFSR